MAVLWAFLCYWVVFTQRQEPEYSVSCSHGEGKEGGDKNDAHVNVQVLAVMWCWGGDLWLGMKLRMRARGSSASPGRRG